MSATTIDSLAAQIFAIAEGSEPFAQLSAQISDIEARVSNLENNNEGVAAALPPANVNINDLASELQDRFFRARNLFLYGIVADNNNPQYDIQQVTHLLSNIPGINLNGLTVHRISSRRQNEPGPIVARLPAQDEVVRVFRNRRLLPPALHLGLIVRKPSVHNYAPLRLKLRNIMRSNLTIKTDSVCPRSSNCGICEEKS